MEDTKKKSLSMPDLKHRIRSWLIEQKYSIDEIHSRVKNTEGENCSNEFLAAIFYPIEIEQGWDSLPALYARRHIHIGLALASKYGNYRAMYHLTEAMKDAYLDRIDDQTDNFIEEMKIRISKSSDQLAISWVDLERTFSPNENDGEALFHDALLQKNKRDALLQLERAYKLGFKRAGIEIARRQKTTRESYDMYITSGEKDELPYGFFMAAEILDRGYMNDPNNTSDELFEKAGESGYLRLIERNIENQSKSEKYAERMLKGGDGSGFRKLGDHYRFKGDLERACEYYHKAGPFDGYHREADITSNPEKSAQIKKEADNYMLQHFKEIRNLSQTNNLLLEK